MVQPRHPQCCHGSDTSHCTGHFRPCRWHRKSIRHLHLKVMIQGIPGTGTRYCLWLKFVETMNHEEGNWLMFSISGESCFLEWQHDFSNLSKKKAIEPCEHRMFIVTENITLLSSRWCQIYLDLPSGQNLCQLFTRKKRPKGRNLTYLEDPAFPHLGYHHPQFSALFAHILQSHLVRFLRARSNGTGSLIRATRATDTVNHLNQLTSSIFRGPNCSFQGEGIFMEKIMQKKVEKEGCKWLQMEESCWNWELIVLARV